MRAKSLLFTYEVFPQGYPITHNGAKFGASNAVLAAFAPGKGIFKKARGRSISPTVLS